MTPPSDHPRIRGEHRILPPDQTLPGGSSPHTRGARSLPPSRPQAPRIIPAYAGSTPGMKWLSGSSQDHPRIRGEHPRSCSTVAVSLGSSPHTRGALEIHARAGHRLGIIPAYAGSTSTRGPPTVSLRDHPRIRGEHFGTHRVPIDVSGSSPHTRGALLERLADVEARRIIPAYAGSTRNRTRPRQGPRDHPRIRGEHYIPLVDGVGQSGSSPHTRGAHAYLRRKGGKSRIIPAYAGSTS